MSQSIEDIRARHDAAPRSEFTESGRFAISSCTTREGKGGTFLLLELRDPTGSLVARCFDGHLVDQLGGMKAIDATLRVSEFNGTISVVVQQASRAELSRDEVLRFAGLNVEQHAARVQVLEGWLAECDGTVYGDILRAVFADPETWRRFTMAAAAVRMHHAEPGGLVRHLVEVGEAGLGLLNSTHEPFDRPFFLAGVFLHDLGKLDTYTEPPTIAYTAQGQMVEHQVYSTYRLGKACAGLNIGLGTEARLIHMIEQAHGAFRHAEWQDPVGVEVKALATADFFSSRLGSTEKERKAQDALDELVEQQPVLGLF